MSYPHYTKCVQPNSHLKKERAIAVAIIAGLLASGVMIAIGGLLGSWFVGVTGCLLGIVDGFLIFADWWLYRRLVCLKGKDCEDGKAPKCAIGMVVSVEPPEEKPWYERLFDSDYSFNLLLPPHHIGDTQTQIENDGVLGCLIKEQDDTKNIGLPFSGYTSKGPGCKDTDTAVLHCEIEGAAMYILYKTFKTVHVLLTGAYIAGAATAVLCAIPVIGWIACAIAAFVAGGLAGAAAAVLGTGIYEAWDDAASPKDIDPSLGGSLHWGCNGKGADLVVVTGDWVYDSLHSGWNELHPVHHIQIIGKWPGKWPFSAQTATRRWCEVIAEAKDPVTKENQEKPENLWKIHPLIDGCVSVRNSE